MESIETIRENFSFFDDWEDKYRFVIELGKELRNPTTSQSKESLKMMFGQTADSIKKAAEENK